MRILHFADLHLDRSFSGLGMASSEASKRREELRAALRRIVDRALALDVDAVTVGGDLYEHGFVTPDTGNFIAEQFRRLAPRTVLLAPGNHDPIVPESLYQRLEWPDNVRIFDTLAWRAESVGETAIWGIGHTGPGIFDNKLRELNVNGNGVNLALFHGSDISALPEGKSAHCPFEREDVERSGADFALLGHYHRMRLWPPESPRYGYPGSSEPLDFGEEGAHHVLLATVERGIVAVEPLQINEVSYQTTELDVTGVSTSDHVRAAIRHLAGDEGPSGTITRVVLTGQAESDLDLDARALRDACHEQFRYLEVLNQTTPAFDLEEVREETTTKGAFARMLLERLAEAPEAERELIEQAMQYGLQAFAGREVKQR